MSTISEVQSPAQLPAPASDRWIDVLHWMICNMQTDDPEMTIVAGFFSFAHNQDGLTPKQSRWANSICRRIVAERKL